MGFFPRISLFSHRRRVGKNNFPFNALDRRISRPICSFVLFYFSGSKKGERYGWSERLTTVFKLISFFYFPESVGFIELRGNLFYIYLICHKFFSLFPIFLIFCINIDVPYRHIGMHAKFKCYLLYRRYKVAKYSCHAYPLPAIKTYFVRNIIASKIFLFSLKNLSYRK